MSNLKSKRGKRSSLVLQTSLVQDNIPAHVLPNIWLGSIHAAFNYEILIEKKITHVINISGLPATFPKKFTYLTMEVRDKKKSNLLSCIPISDLFIEFAIKEGGNILIHCSAGRSRSPAILIAYMMKKFNISYEKSLFQVKSIRSVISLNQGFIIQLKAYESSKYDIFLAHSLLLSKKIKNTLLHYNKSIKENKETVIENELYNKNNTFIKNIVSPTKDKIFLSTDTSISFLYRKRYINELTEKKNSPIKMHYLPKKDKKSFIQSNEMIPNFLSLSTEYACSSCNTILFSSWNILRHNNNNNKVLKNDHYFDLFINKIQQKKEWENKILTIFSNDRIDTNWKNDNRYCIKELAEADNKAMNNISCGTNIYLEPLDWMGLLKNENDIIYCPEIKCKKALGNWNWKGIKCDCGFIITPAFQININHIKEYKTNLSNDIMLLNNNNNDNDNNDKYNVSFTDLIDEPDNSNYSVIEKKRSFHQEEEKIKNT